MMNNGDQCFGCFGIPTSAPTPVADAAAKKDGLSSGALAGIIIGSILGVAALGGFYFYCIKGSDSGSDGGARREMVPLKV
jgi:O-antigen/teichoic acid export membrane protein